MITYQNKFTDCISFIGKLGTQNTQQLGFQYLGSLIHYGYIKTF